MKKIMTVLASAVVATTSLTGPAKADDFDTQVRTFFQKMFAGQTLIPNDTQFRTRSYTRDDDDKRGG